MVTAWERRRKRKRCILTKIQRKRYHKKCVFLAFLLCSSKTRMFALLSPNKSAQTALSVLSWLQHKGSCFNLSSKHLQLNGFPFSLAQNRGTVKQTSILYSLYTLYVFSLKGLSIVSLQLPRQILSRCSFSWNIQTVCLSWLSEIIFECLRNCFYTLKAPFSSDKGKISRK